MCRSAYEGQAGLPHFFLVVNFKGGFGAELIIGLFTPDQTQAKLDEILDRLDDIQTSINTLSNTVKLANYDAAFREKETMYINLQSKTVDTWLTLQALDKNKTLSSEERISKRKDVVKKWGGFKYKWCRKCKLFNCKFR